jgi:hypothetical protein
VGHYGFGEGEFGINPFGDVDYAKIVLWDELPPDLKDDDERQGYPYKTFVESMAPNFQWIRNHIRRFRYIVDPRRIRLDLLEWFGQNFGIAVDVAEPEAFQRMRANLAARWNIIKGTVDSYVVLCRVHGFEVEVVPLWWTGTEFSETVPGIFGETSTVTPVYNPGDTTFTIRFGCYPIEPGTITIQLRRFAGPFVAVTDDGVGGWNGGIEGSIDYGWGYATLVYPEVNATYISSSYDSVVGGCPESCVKCKTHRLRLRITPGDIGGQDELTISEAFQRLYRKLGVLTGDGVIPVHVELEQLSISGVATISIGYRYDVLEADAYTVDYGLRWLVP